jgi:hypothetical protein
MDPGRAISLCTLSALSVFSGLQKQILLAIIAIKSRLTVSGGRLGLFLARQISGS